MKFFNVIHITKSSSILLMEGVATTRIVLYDDTLSQVTERLEFFRVAI